MGFVLKWTSHLTGKCSSALHSGTLKEGGRGEREEEEEELSLEEVSAQSYTEGISM